MVGLDIDANLILQPEALEEAVNALGVEIILMLGRLMRLGFDQDHALEADLVLVFDDQLQETPEIRLLDAEIGVEDGVITLAPAP